MAREDSINQGRLSKSGLSLPPQVQPSKFLAKRDVYEWTRIRTNDDDIELETALQKLMLNLLSDTIETDIRARTDFFDCSHFNKLSRGKEGRGCAGGMK